MRTKPERWRRIETLFEAALELDDAAQREYLDRACAGDLGLRREIEALLEADARALSFLSADAASFAAPALAELSQGVGFPPLTPDLQSEVGPGAQLGPYRLVLEVGHGGMSVVFQAERADGQFEQQVAIKLLRRLDDSREQATKRFRAEGRILASLKHPNISQISDAGVTAGGRPYLVMEYVDGQPIDRHCEE